MLSHIMSGHSATVLTYARLLQDRAYDGLLRRGPFVNQRELSIQPGEETHCKLLVTEATLITGNETHAQVRYTSPRDIVYVYSRPEQI